MTYPGFQPSLKRLRSMVEGWKHLPDSAAVTVPLADLRAALDKIDGLDEDLHSAVQVAFRRGATEWTRRNYPGWHAEFAAVSPRISPRQRRPKD